MITFEKVQDSGKREEFNTGSKRDTQKGKGRPDLIPTMPLRRLAVHYENGADKYGERNWEKGQPLGRYWASAFRHLLAIKDGDVSEDHCAAVIWNVMSLMQTQEWIEEKKLPRELDDLGIAKKEQSVKFALPEIAWDKKGVTLIASGTLDQNVVGKQVPATSGTVYFKKRHAEDWTPLQEYRYNEDEE